MAKLKLGVIFGGVSEEHGVSVKSAQEVARSLDPGTYEPYFVGITRAGEWRLCDEPRADWESCDPVSVMLSPDRVVHGLLVLAETGVTTIRLDLVFPVLHGKSGEDGAIQGLLELAGIPYIGCGVQTSALCMDKSLTYLVARDAGIPTPKFWVIQPNEAVDASQFTFPVFVKPARSGSSFGVSKVSCPEELADAVKAAQAFDSKIMIEEAVVGSEVGCAVLGNAADLVVGEVDQITLSHGFFKIHQESNPEGGSENATITVPAAIPEADRERVKTTAKALYRALGCRGLSRVDMFLTDDGQIVLNEINTLPGLTSYSRYPRMMAAAGIPLAGIIDRLVWFTFTGSAR